MSASNTIMSEWIGLAHNGRLCVQILRRYSVLSTDLTTIPQWASFCTHKDFSVVRYSVLHGSEQLFASKHTSSCSFRALALVEELGAGGRPRMVGANRQAPLACESVSIRPAETAVWSATHLFAGCLFPLSKHIHLDTYYEHANNTGPHPNHQVNAAGLIIDLFKSETCLRQANSDSYILDLGASFNTTAHSFREDRP